MSNGSWRTISRKGRLERLVSTFFWHPFFPKDDRSITINIYEIDNGGFEAVPEEGILSTGQGDLYRTVENGNSMEDALSKAISALSIFIREPDNTQFIRPDTND